MTAVPRYPSPVRTARKFLEQCVAHGVEIEPVLGDQRARLDDDVVDVADQLEPLVEVLTAQAQPLAENFHEVDDLEAASVAASHSSRWQA